MHGGSERLIGRTAHEGVQAPEPTLVTPCIGLTPDRGITCPCFRASPTTDKHRRVGKNFAGTVWQVLHRPVTFQKSPAKITGEARTTIWRSTSPAKAGSETVVKQKRTAAQFSVFCCPGVAATPRRRVDNSYLTPQLKGVSLGRRGRASTYITRRIFFSTNIPNNNTKKRRKKQEFLGLANIKTLNL